jgi:hypothetical protein
MFQNKFILSVLALHKTQSHAIQQAPRLILSHNLVHLNLLNEQKLCQDCLSSNL